MVKHSDIIPDNILDLYKAEDSIEVVDHGDVPVEVIKRDLLDFSNNNVTMRSKAYAIMVQFNIELKYSKDYRLLSRRRITIIRYFPFHRILNQG